jgi:hypothetical protein
LGHEENIREQKMEIRRQLVSMLAILDSIHLSKEKRIVNHLYQVAEELKKHIKNSRDTMSQ